MDAVIVLLANSRKLGGRCLAGVELSFRTGNKFHIKKENNRCKWLRPVSNHENGEISEAYSGEYHNLDIVRLSNFKAKPMGHQAENCLFQSINKIHRINPSENNLRVLCDQQKRNIFGNYGKAVHPDKIGELDYSLMLIEVKDFSGYEKEDHFGRSQKRGIFNYFGHQYDLAITDPSYELGSEGGKIVFLTISLGIEYEGFFHKLIAGVFCV